MGEPLLALSPWPFLLLWRLLRDLLGFLEVPFSILCSIYFLCVLYPAFVAPCFYLVR